MAITVHFVENRSDFLRFKDRLDGKVVYLVSIFGSPKAHPVVNSLSVLIFGVSDAGGQRQATPHDEYFVFALHHNDVLSLPIEWLYELSPRLVITPQKKRLLHKLSSTVPFPIIDYKHIEHQRHIDTKYEDFQENATKSFLNKHSLHVKNINKAVPIFEWVSYAMSVIEHMQSQGLKTVPDSTLEDVIIPTTLFIEKSGIHVEPDKYIERYGARVKQHIVNDLVYSEYNPYTLTGRCSCGWDGVNFTALNKKDGTRDIFTSRFAGGQMALIDFESFHLRLIANWMEYKLPSSSVHTFLGQKYFNKFELTDDEYEESKRITFKNLYSEDKLQHPIDFFQSVYDKSQVLYDQFLENGFLVTPAGQVLDSIEDASRSKVFNYFVQMLETETAMEIIHQMIPMWSKVKSKIVLYTYDSLLLDVHPSEVDLIHTTSTHMTSDGKWPVRVYTGASYGTLQRQDTSFLPK